MQACEFPHIPERLHTNDKDNIPVFGVGERLYWRVKPGNKHGPPYTYFSAVTLSDISVNRCGGNNKLSQPEDVLFNINSATPEKFDDHDILIFTIPNAGADEIFPDDNVKLELKLIHDPLPCNYPHSMFRFILNGVIVTFTNYKETLGAKGEFKKALEKQRMASRDHLHKLIVAHHSE